ncbi:GTPase [Pseudothermotoga thermarum]|uniref:Ribosome biogenesis GTPase A n=1 Tax=Pseudothermotoga thermarum DSM 5069 TaxID=688269 RepID=F7YUF5_9THEM|nr:GTPase [Pseudothermotoga thermarum]AEH51358.1 ribosome biogenesis GTP-binding protein YlqF [Pseudothermotoga thermarum DSM 5069]
MWYPGHMAKAARMLEKIKKHIDLFVELLDARAPIATRSYDRNIIKGKRNVILLTKSDLADPVLTQKWKKFFESKGENVFVVDKNSSRQSLINFISKFAPKNSLIAIVGCPNVGKSTVINKLKGTRSAKVGAVPGITRGLQWFSVEDLFRVLDTPGLLLPKISEIETAAKLLLVGSLPLELTPPEVLQKAYEIYAKLTKKDSVSFDEFIEAYALEKKMLAKGGVLDKERAIVSFFNNISQGKIGRITFEIPQEAIEDKSDSLPSA